jgi:hypothetical protein
MLNIYINILKLSKYIYRERQIYFLCYLGMCDKGYYFIKYANVFLAPR